MKLLVAVVCTFSTLLCEASGSWTCCETFLLASDGDAAVQQSSRLGEYNLVEISSSGKGTYSQANGDNYLFYVVGVGNGGIYNHDDGDCPESLKEDWIIWNSDLQDYQDDRSVQLGCEWKEEECATGSACEGCEIHHEMMGVDYCCARDCDTGRMEISNSGGEPDCTCYH